MGLGEKRRKNIVICGGGGAGGAPANVWGGVNETPPPHEGDSK